MRKSSVGRAIAILCLVLACAGAFVVAVRTVDALNVPYKRLKADSPFVYEEIRPELAAVDPETLLAIRSPEDVAARRAALRGWIYGTATGARQVSRLVDPGAGWSHAEEVADWRGLQSVAQFFINVRPSVISHAYMLRPDGDPNGRALIYHHGMASDFRAARAWLEPFLKDGWHILAFDQLGYGENSREVPCDTPADPAVPCRANLQSGLAQVQSPVALHVEPVLAGLDHLEEAGFTAIDAMGFSAGAATVTFAAAIDPRIKRTAAVAGILPPYLREGQDEAFGIAEALAVSGPVSFLDLFLLAGAGKDRRYLQVFNRFDRCCFRNLKGRHYESVLKDRLAGTGDGAFSVHIDESHARHTVSAEGVAVIRAMLSGDAGAASD